MMMMICDVVSVGGGGEATNKRYWDGHTRTDNVQQIQRFKLNCSALNKKETNKARNSNENVVTKVFSLSHSFLSCCLTRNHLVDDSFLHVLSLIHILIINCVVKKATIERECGWLQYFCVALQQLIVRYAALTSVNVSAVVVIGESINCVWQLGFYLEIIYNSKYIINIYSFMIWNYRIKYIM